MTEEQFNKSVLFLEKMIAEHPERKDFLDAYLKILEQNTAYNLELKKLEVQRSTSDAELQCQFDIARNNNNTDYDIARYRSNTEFNIAQNGYYTQRYQQDQRSYRETIGVFANRGLFDNLPKLNGF